MSRKLRKKVQWGLKRVEELLERNACHSDTFYRVLNRADVRALRSLANFVEDTLVAKKRGA
ncbi:MAG: hypothetical protein A3D93_01755 [Acidobacteria bacterium RIFCSPHIGHO2_12_FULL_67_30]|nr:MAG: hypothetical protein A3D93_01755 [Acidobacteria bacterium RIFCSPHIGHO2_12_FULL_67_30]